MPETALDQATEGATRTQPQPGSGGPGGLARRTPRPTFGRWFRSTGWRHLVAWLALAFALFPVWWVIGGAFSDSGLSTQKVIPDSWTLDNFRDLFEQPFWTWFRNSMVVGVLTAAGTVLFCALAAFAFSRLRFRGRRPGLLSLLLIQMFPNTLAVVAIYLIFIDVDELFPGIGIGTIWSIILVYLGGALGVNTWLMKGFFDTLPIELDESAKVDGATHAQVFYKVVLPLATPVLAVIGLLSFIITQAEFLIADTLSANQSNAQTLSAGLSRFVLGSQFDTRWGPFAAGALIGAVPVVVLFLFLQRFIVSGLTSGAVKG